MGRFSQHRPGGIPELVLGCVLFAIGGFILWFALYVATRDQHEAPLDAIAGLVGLVACFFLVWGSFSMVAIESRDLSVRVAAISLIGGVLPYAIVFDTPGYAANVTFLLMSASSVLCMWIRRTS